MKREQNKYIFAPVGGYKTRRHIFRNTVLILLPMLIVLVFALNFVFFQQPVLRKLNLTVLNLPADLEQYSILHLSDLHGAEYGKDQKAIAAALGNIRYSCVVMTGDMLGEGHDTRPLLELVELMPKETPKYYIPGDTDGDWLDDRAHGTLSIYKDWATELQQAGIILLDRPISETRQKGTVWFVPEELYTLDLKEMSASYSEQLDRLNKRSASLTPDDAARKRVVEYELERYESIRETVKSFKAEDLQIVLTHTPLSESYVEEISSWTGKEDFFSLRYAGLILAGHYNGGQWRLPGIGPVYVPELGWFPEDREIQGLSYPNGTPQYISPGLGSDPHYEHQPGRFYNQPVITLITLSRRTF